MNGITTITTKGQVTIPESIRRALQAKVGDKVSFTQLVTTHKEVIIKILPANIVDYLFGSLSSKVKTTDQRQVRRGAGKNLIRKYQISS